MAWENCWVYIPTTEYQKEVPEKKHVKIKSSPDMFWRSFYDELTMLCSRIVFFPPVSWQCSFHHSKVHKTSWKNEQFFYPTHPIVSWLFTKDLALCRGQTSSFIHSERVETQMSAVFLNSEWYFLFMTHAHTHTHTKKKTTKAIIYIVGEFWESLFCRQEI